MLLRVLKAWEREVGWIEVERDASPSRDVGREQREIVFVALKTCELCKKGWSGSAHRGIAGEGARRGRAQAKRK
jgi:hypothetical protein